VTVDECLSVFDCSHRSYHHHDNNNDRTSTSIGMAERKFSRLKNSTRTVTAAQARESVAQTIRQSSLMVCRSYCCCSLVVDGMFPEFTSQ
jgi:hypothetical protein